VLLSHCAPTNLLRSKITSLRTEGLNSGAKGGPIFFRKVWGGSDAEAKAASVREAKRNGYDGGAAEKIVANTPPQFGPFAGTNKAVEVMIYRQHNTLLFSAVVSNDSLTVSTLGGCRTRAYGQGLHPRIKSYPDACADQYRQYLSRCAQMRQDEQRCLSLGQCSRSECA
jgi:hypothetical protein